MSASFTLEKHIQAPIEVVFDRTSDVRRWAGTVKGIIKTEVLTEGPIGVGTRFRETRKMFGREAVEEMEFTQFDRPNAYAFGCDNHGCHYQTEFRLTQAAGGTDLKMTFQATGLTLLARIMGFVMRPMMKFVMKECAKDLEEIRIAIEAEAKV